jgi:hypothetical protein
MSSRVKARCTATVLLLIVLTACGGSTAGKREKEEDTRKLAIDAYIYGYPLVLMDVTRQVKTAVSKAEDGKAPLNQFAHVRTLPDHTFAAVPYPNADVLYSFAWLDLTKEPVILSVPDTRKRYYFVAILDAWTNVFASLGARTTGTTSGNFAIIGPGWTGTLPDGVKEIDAPTSMVWLIGQTEVNGDADYAAARAIQEQYRLTPLSAWGKPHTPPSNVPIAAGVDASATPADQVARMDTATFFGRLNALMADNPAPAADDGALARFATVGVVPGKAFDLKNLDPGTARAVERAMQEGHAALTAEAKKTHGTNVNGWQMPPRNMGNYATDYMWRAVAAMTGLGANSREDEIDSYTTVDSQREPLNGANKYMLRFPRGQLPPVNGFWSLSAYNSKGAFAENSLRRYTIGNRDNPEIDRDGSLIIYIQHDSPGKDRESNWLPAPVGPFHLYMRLYWPKLEFIDGSWQMPPVERVN